MCVGGHTNQLIKLYHLIYHQKSHRCSNLIVKVLMDLVPLHMYQRPCYPPAILKVMES